MLSFISIWLIASVLFSPLIGALVAERTRPRTVPGNIERVFVSTLTGTKYGNVDAKFYGS